MTETMTNEERAEGILEEMKVWGLSNFPLGAKEAKEIILENLNAACDDAVKAERERMVKIALEIIQDLYESPAFCIESIEFADYGRKFMNGVEASCNYLRKEIKQAIENNE